MTDSMVYAVDDNPQILSDVKDILGSANINVRTHASAEEFIQQNLSHDASCLILDLCMPGMKGLELIGWLRARKINMPIIVLSSHGDIPSVVESIKLGATEFLEKPPDRDGLIEAVQRLLQSEMEQVTERAKMRRIRESFAKLTNRENEIVEMLTNGLSSKQIAATAGISVKTVDNHRSHVLAKTSAGNVASLVRMKMMMNETYSYGH